MPVKRGQYARVAPLDEDCVPTLKYVVICARYEGKWVFVRHRERDTWETPGGHIDPGESPAQAAARELYEEAGIRDAEIIPILDYWAQDGDGNSWGRVFYAKARALGDIPEEFEMAERMLSESLPDRLTYPYILGKLFPTISAECNKQ